MQTHRLEGHRAAVGIEHARLLPARHGGFGHGVGSDLREVGILVGTQQRDAALRHALVLGSGRCVARATT